MITGYQWELYNTDEDFSQADNLVTKYPDKLNELQLVFYTEAARYDVLPLDDSRLRDWTRRSAPASPAGGRNSHTRRANAHPRRREPDLKNKSYSITASLEAKDRESGMIFTVGGLFSGIALYLEAGKPVFHYNFLDVAHYEVAGSQALPAGKHTIKLEFAYDGGGLGKGGLATLFVDGQEAAKGRVEKTVPIRVSLDEGTDVGEDTGTPVNLKYDVPFKFAGRIEKVTVELK